MANGYSPRWIRDREDPRVVAALERKCGVCGARKGRECGWRRGRPGEEVFRPLATGVVHEVRVPKSVLHRRSA